MPTRGAGASGRARRRQIVRRRDLHVALVSLARSRTACPARSASIASSVASHAVAPSAIAASSTSRRNPCGVCASQISSRGIVSAHDAGDRDRRASRCRAPATAGTAAPRRGGRGDHPIDQRRVGERPRGVVDQHTSDLRGQRRQRRARPSPAAARRRRRTDTAASSAQRATARTATRSAGSTTTSLADAGMRVERRDAALQHACGRRGRATAWGPARPAAAPRPAATMMAPTDMQRDSIGSGPGSFETHGIRVLRSELAVRCDPAARELDRARDRRLAAGDRGREDHDERARRRRSSPSCAPNRTSDCRTARVVGQREPAGDVHGVLANARVLLARRPSRSVTSPANRDRGRTDRTAAATRASTS